MCRRGTHERTRTATEFVFLGARGADIRATEIFTGLNLKPIGAVPAFRIEDLHFSFEQISRLQHKNAVAVLLRRNLATSATKQKSSSVVSSINIAMSGF